MEGGARAAPAFLGVEHSATGRRWEARLADDRPALARSLFRAYNDWAAEHAAGDDRVRPVHLLHGDTPAQLLAAATGAVGRKARAVAVLSGEPLAGHSPADPALDPFYELLAEHDVALTVHLGSEGGFVATTRWREAPSSWASSSCASCRPMRVSPPSAKQGTP